MKISEKIKKRIDKFLNMAYNITVLYNGVITGENE